MAFLVEPLSSPRTTQGHFFRVRRIGVMDVQRRWRSHASPYAGGGGGGGGGDADAKDEGGWRRRLLLLFPKEKAWVPSDLEEAVECVSHASWNRSFLPLLCFPPCGFAELFLVPLRGGRAVGRLPFLPSGSR